MFRKLTHYAPRVLLGAFFLLTSCKDEPSANSSPEDPTAPKTTQEIPPPPSGGKKPADKPETVPVSTDGIRFMAYNLKNYLTMERYIEGGGKKLAPKDPAEINALIQVIVSEKPDILGICEIGTPEDLADLQTRLKAAGLDLPHTIHTGGADQTRHLGLLSAIPIEANRAA